MTAGLPDRVSRSQPLDRDPTPRASCPGSFVGLPGRLFDRLERLWESDRVERLVGTSLVIVFIVAMAVIELNRQDLLPRSVAARLTTNHFGAVGVAFAVLLALEVVGLVFALAHSVANSVGKQFELLSLILLRKAFLEFSGFGEPVEWERIAHSVPVILADLGGALVIFLLVGLFYRVQRHRPITQSEREQAGFVCSKKVIALLLLVTFAVMAAGQLIRLGNGHGAHHFFEQFYTVLILSDILIVLVSLRYTSDYRVIFRNSGFAAATVLIRLAPFPFAPALLPRPAEPPRKPPPLDPSVGPTPQGYGPSPPWRCSRRGA